MAEIEAELRAYRQACDPALSTLSLAAWVSAVNQSTGQASMTLAQANCLTAQLAGFFPRNAYPYPGPKVLARGLVILAELVRYERIRNPPPP